jgi:hypothetical protein
MGNLYFGIDFIYLIVPKLPLGNAIMGEAPASLYQGNNEPIFIGLFSPTRLRSRASLVVGSQAELGNQENLL